MQSRGEPELGADEGCELKVWGLLQGLGFRV